MKKARKIMHYFLRKFDKKFDPNVISHSEAMTFFNHRIEQYDDLISAVIPHVPKKGIFFDIGACIGFFSLLIMKRINFTGTAYLFEPVPNLAKLCIDTFKDTSYNVNIFNFALGDKNVYSKMLTDTTGNIGWNTFLSDKRTKNMREITVEMKTFDSLNLDVTPCFIKIDVEGSEYKVIRGMLRSLRIWKPRPVILCEVGWGKTHPNWAEELESFNQLRDLGYTPLNLMNKEVDLNQLNRTTDIIFSP